jgi:chemotaxis protein methyltransferase CheR
MRRLNDRKLDSFEAYYRLIHQPVEEHERQLAIDALTTHETYFFREPKHFEWLKDFLRDKQRPGSLIRVWSAAASTGEEVWSIAMLLADCLGIDGLWQLMGSDISQPVLDKAKTGHYVMQRCEGIPLSYLKKYCLKGQGSQMSTMLLVRELRQRVSFQVVNLNEELPGFAPMDVIFLRNVLIYFDANTKKAVVRRCVERLTTGGFLIVSHSESLNDVNEGLVLVRAGVYQKVA